MGAEKKKDVWVDDKGVLHYKTYLHAGNMMYLREALDPDSPNHLYNYIKSHGITPEDYGIYHPDYEEYVNMSKEQLLSELILLKQQIRSLERAGFL